MDGVKRGGINRFILTKTLKVVESHHFKNRHTMNSSNVSSGMDAMAFQLEDCFAVMPKSDKVLGGDTW